ncbi:hypothetical protein AAKU55_005470 [Oxalobacteraceae bacterium GrIS 1.11]
MKRDARNPELAHQSVPEQEAITSSRSTRKYKSGNFLARRLPDDELFKILKSGT